MACYCRVGITGRCKRLGKRGLQPGVVEMPIAGANK